MTTAHWIPAVLALAGISSTVTAQVRTPTPISGPLKYLEMDWATGEITETLPPVNSADAPVTSFSNSTFAGFASIQPTGEEAVDFGVKATGLSGVVSTLTIAYATSALDPALGGPGAGLDFNLYAGTTGACATTPTEPGNLVIGFDFTGLPGSPDGSLVAFALTINFAPTAVAVPDGALGWSYESTDGVSGPLLILVGADPTGTVDSIDLYSPPPAGAASCQGSSSFTIPGVASFFLELLEDDGTSTPTPVVAATAKISGAAADSEFGGQTAPLGDLDGDGIEDVAVGAASDDEGGVDTGAAFVLFLNTDGSAKAQQKISDTQGGLSGPLDAGDELGSGLTSLGDLDGDGVADLAAGAPGDDDGGTDRGAVYVLFLNTDGTVKSEQKISDTLGGFGGALDDGDRFGSSVASLGDVDGDGVGDLAAGAEGDDDGGTDRGAVYVLFLNTDGTVKAQQKISAAQGGFSGILDDSDLFGTALASLGDLDGDGVPDLAVGASRDDDGGADHGALWVLFLNADGTVKAQQKISDTAGGFGGALADGDLFGFDANSLGDLDGDGVRDLGVGAPGDDGGGADRGAFYLLFLDGDGTVKAEEKVGGALGGFTGALDDADRFGASVDVVGDLDGDGVGDLAVGALGDDDGGSDSGAVYILFLDAPGGGCTFRNGSGINPADFACVSPPIIGQAFVSTIVVDPAIPVTIVALGAPAAGFPNFLGPGELLLSLAPFPFLLDVASGTHTLPVPGVVTLAGAEFSAQGFRAEFDLFGTVVIAARNALDLSVGP